MNHLRTFVSIFVLLASGGGQQAGPNISTSLAKLSSAKWTDRYSSYQRLVSDPAAVRRENVKAALLDLLDRENRLIESTNRDDQGPSVDDKYGEEYAEYIAQLGDTIDSFADWKDQHQVCILVRQPYEWDSRFAAKIASHARASVPCLIQMYGSDVGLTRAEAAPTLVRAVAAGKTELDFETIRQARSVMLRALRDSHDAVRSKTVRALGRFGGPDMISPLKQMAQSDPVLKEVAAKAIADIQNRSGDK